jgi:hypothetical protein
MPFCLCRKQSKFSEHDLVIKCNKGDFISSLYADKASPDSSEIRIVSGTLKGQLSFYSRKKEGSEQPQIVSQSFPVLNEGCKYVYILKDISLFGCNGDTQLTQYPKSKSDPRLFEVNASIYKPDKRTHSSSTRFVLAKNEFVSFVYPGQIFMIHSSRAMIHTCIHRLCPDQAIEAVPLDFIAHEVVAAEDAELSRRSPGPTSNTDETPLLRYMLTCEYAEEAAPTLRWLDISQPTSEILKTGIPSKDRLNLFGPGSTGKGHRNLRYTTAKIGQGKISMSNKTSSSSEIYEGLYCVICLSENYKPQEILVYSLPDGNLQRKIHPFGKFRILEISIKSDLLAILDVSGNISVVDLSDLTCKSTHGKMPADFHSEYRSYLEIIDRHRVAVSGDSGIWLVNLI